MIKNQCPTCGHIEIGFEQEEWALHQGRISERDSKIAHLREIIRLYNPDDALFDEENGGLRPFADADAIAEMRRGTDRPIVLIVDDGRHVLNAAVRDVLAQHGEKLWAPLRQHLEQIQDRHERPERLVDDAAPKKTKAEWRRAMKGGK